jgi:hypothetical protein
VADEFMGSHPYERLLIIYGRAGRAEDAARVAQACLRHVRMGEGTNCGLGASRLSAHHEKARTRRASRSLLGRAWVPPLEFRRWPGRCWCCGRHCSPSRSTREADWSRLPPKGMEAEAKLPAASVT